jgi:hypothetical protein
VRLGTASPYTRLILAAGSSTPQDATKLALHRIAARLHIRSSPHLPIGRIALMSSGQPRLPAGYLRVGQRLLQLRVFRLRGPQHVPHAHRAALIGGEERRVQRYVADVAPRYGQLR